MRQLSRLSIFFVSLLLIVLCIFTFLTDGQAVEITASGTCGDNVTWILDDEGTLTISGTGSVDSYSNGYAPWYSYTNDITAIVVEKGVTVLPKGIFYGCSEVETVTIPFVGGCEKTAIDPYQYPFGYIFGSNRYTGGIAITQRHPGYNHNVITHSTYYLPDNLKTVIVTGGKILYGAFSSCYTLTSVIIPDNVTTIGGFSFYFCGNLSDVYIPNNVISLGQGAFSECINLTNITIPKDLICVLEDAFYNCNNLTQVFYKGTTEAKDSISLESNSELNAATWHYECVDTIVNGQDCVFCPACEKYYLLDGSEVVANVLEPDEQGYVKLTGDVFASMELAGNLYLELNGHNLSGTIITNGYKVYGMDSATNQYTCDATGTFSCVDENGNAIVPESLYTHADAKRYMTIGTDNGYTFHRYYLGITNITLAPSVTGFGYKAEFYGDEMVQAQIASIGYNLWLTEDVVVSRNSAFKNVLTLRLKNFDVENYGETPVNACVRITLVDGTVITGETHSNTMKQVVESVNTNYESLTEAQMAAVNTMIASTPTMQTWQIENLYKKES